MDFLAFAQTVPVPDPTEVAGQIHDKGLFYLIGVSWAVTAFMFALLLLTWNRRMADRDARDKRLDALQEKHAAKLEALATDMRNVVLENGRQMFTLARYIEDARPAAKKKPPALSPEPTSQVLQAPKEDA